MTQRADFEQVFDLDVGDKTLREVEFTVTPDGNFQYRVPDCIGPGGAFVNQVTMNGVTSVTRDDFHEALIEKASELPG